MNDNIIGTTIASLEESSTIFAESNRQVEKFYDFTIRFLKHVRNKPDELNSSYPHWVKKCEEMIKLYNESHAKKVDHITSIMQAVDNLTIAKSIADSKTPAEKLESYLELMGSVNAPVTVCKKDILNYAHEMLNDTISTMMETPKDV